MNKDFSNLIGIPYERLNCWDLAVKFYDQCMGLKLQQYYDNFPTNKNEVCGLIRANEKDFIRVKAPKFGDLITAKLFGVESHIMVYVDNGLVLHTQKKVGSCIDRLSRWQHLVVGYYSLTGDPKK